MREEITILDDNFLEELELWSFPLDQKQAFLQTIYDELEFCVGEKLVDGMSDEELDEVDVFMNQKPGEVRQLFGNSEQPVSMA
jgi:hypothetical protein